jgi:hypothetical protein
MNRKDYFKNLVSLYEAIGDEDILPASQDQFNPDAGANVEGTIDDQPMGQQGMVNQDAGAPDSQSDMQSALDLGDADYLSGEEFGALPPEDTIEVSEPKKLAKLFQLYKELLNYSTVFYESLDTIDMNLLDIEKSEKIRENKNQIINIVEKIEDYLIDTFPNETYEKALYIYIHLRTELMTIIKLLRESLDLNAPE